MVKKVPIPTEGELAILRVLWARKSAMTVREVHAVLIKGKATAYTTVLKMLTIMAEKGLVRRDESERSHTYRPVQTEHAVQASLLKDLMRRAFSGSPVSMMQRALDDEIASDADLKAIEKLIAESKTKKRGG